MRTRFISVLCALAVALGINVTPLASLQAAATPAPAGQVAPAKPQAQLTVPQMKKKAKKPPKWVCSRIYINGKPARPTAVKVWCNGGKTLVKFKTVGMKPGVKDNHSTLRYFKTKKGKYYNFIVAFVKQPGGSGELRVFYYYGTKKKPKFAIVLRDPFRQTPKQSRVLV